MTNKHRNQIEEFNIIEAIKSNSIERFHINRRKDGRYELLVFFTWTKEDVPFYLASQRRDSRTWVNLNNMIKHIEQNYFLPPSITLTFDE